MGRDTFARVLHELHLKVTHHTYIWLVNKFIWSVCSQYVAGTVHGLLNPSNPAYKPSNPLHTKQRPHRPITINKHYHTKYPAVQPWNIPFSLHSKESTDTNSLNPKIKRQKNLLCTNKKGMHHNYSSQPHQQHTQQRTNLNGTSYANLFMALLEKPLETLPLNK